MEHRVIKSYAGSLFDIAVETDSIDETYEELCFLKELLLADEKLMYYLSAPVISRNFKHRFIDRTFKGRLSENTVSFLKVVTKNNILTAITGIYEMYFCMLNEYKKIQAVTVTSSVKLDTAIIKKLKTTLEEKFNKTIILNEVIDESISGGIVLKTTDILIDASLAKDFKNLKKKLLQSEIRTELVYEN